MKRLKNKVQKYGYSVSWPQYLRKWTTGTRTVYFTAHLREALCPSDYRRDPVVHDLMSFDSWYQRFLQRQRNRERDLAEHARLFTIQKVHLRSKETPTSPVSNPVLKRTPASKIVDRKRQGPAPPVTSNRHSNLFFRPPDSSSKIRATPANIHEGWTCYNCNKKGHIAKDCPLPRQPRRMRNQNKQQIRRQSLKTFVASLLREAPTNGAVPETVDLDG